MLVTFTTSAYADITMFGDVALHLLKLMGHSGTVPGALLAEDIPPALQRLEAAVEADKQSAEPEQWEEDDEKVSLAHRAFPLIKLLRAAALQDANVMWDSNS